MIIILTVSSGTFAFRAVIEILFLFDVSVLDFEYVKHKERIIRFARYFFHKFIHLLVQSLTFSETTKGNMHVIGSHLYAS